MTVKEFLKCANLDQKITIWYRQKNDEAFTYYNTDLTINMIYREYIEKEILYSKIVTIKSNSNSEIIIQCVGKKQYEEQNNKHKNNGKNNTFFKYVADILSRDYRNEEKSSTDN